MKLSTAERDYLFTLNYNALIRLYRRVYNREISKGGATFGLDRRTINRHAAAILSWIDDRICGLI